MKYLALLITLYLPVFSYGQSTDWRLISNGQKIYEHGYCDQPYIVTTSDGAWVCAFTTAPGHEGSKVQYIVSTCSFDKGKTWSEPVEIETASAGIEASWAIPLVTTFDRIYVFYTFNGDTIRHLPDGTEMRADTHGWYCYRYSDDKGKTWSERFRLNMRKTACDRQNDFSGDVQMFWGIGKPVVKENDVWFSFTKLGKYFLEGGEGWLYYSDNILTEKDVSNIHWQLLPEGDHGIRNPEFGSVQEEFNVQPMNKKDGLYCVYRTTLGQPACSYSYDKGKTWSGPELMDYATGLPLRNPRACPRLWKCENGKYLLWYHNNGGQDFQHRNPAWVAGGVEKNGKIYWSQPEIIIYGHDHSYKTGRFSYPDLVQEGGRYWVSTTQKTTATIHEIPAGFFKMIWRQFDEPAVVSDGLVDSFDDIGENKKLNFSQPLTMKNGGFAFDLWIKIDEFDDAVILKGNDDKNKNIKLALTKDANLEFIITDGVDTIKLKSDANRLEKGKNHHVAILVDADAEICYMLIDGSICDGGGQEIFGFRRFGDSLTGLQVRSVSLKKFSGKIDKLRLYGQRMYTSQFVNNYNFEKREMTR